MHWYPSNEPMKGFNMMNTTRKLIQSVVIFAVMSLLAFAARAAEIRMLTAMPTANKTTPGELTKSKKSGWKCDKVKQKQDSGNAGKVKNSKSQWFSDVAADQDDAADARLAEGKSAARCTLMSWQRGKMRNAELGDTAADD